ncbi:hypothetical protein [Mucilaginibacter auburnensis]|uniref:Lipoprotein n=1 Tax=Mucilaginibacter auburnensis TaxID=1457233 RepID=A0A2H9VTK8_9SPHI|nr:hypothetical protein [Mucilaginibacter auburnensis]PJJ84155.1 hypothetical protein CLV57_1164 [Mucilaginibacter auburnensis]
MKNLTVKLFLLPLFTLVVTFTACKKDSGLIANEAKIIDSGPVAADGCGWLIRVGDVNYSPTNLDNKYKETELTVILTYRVLSSKFVCGWGNKIDEIEIVSIRRK